MATPLKRAGTFSHYGTDVSTPKRQRMFEPSQNNQMHKIQQQVHALQKQLQQQQMIIQNQNMRIAKLENILRQNQVEETNLSTEPEEATPKLIDERLIRIFSDLPFPEGECNLILDQEAWEAKLKKETAKISRQITREISGAETRKAKFCLGNLSNLEKFKCKGIISDGKAFVSQTGSQHEDNEDVFIQFTLDVLTREGMRSATCVAVFDGHGGNLAAKFCHDHLEESLKICLGGLNASGQDFEIVNAMKISFVRLDASYRKEHERHCGSRPGSAALMVLIIGKRLYVANSGDCRALLIPDDPNVFKLLSFDYDAEYEDAAKTVIKRGGKIVYCHEAYRVEGSLMMTRAIGDEYLRSKTTGIKPITSRPGVITLDLSVYENQSHLQLLICSDGLTGAGYSHKIAQAVCEARKLGKNSIQTANLLLRAARKDKVSDDITVGIWDLKTLIFQKTS